MLATCSVFYETRFCYRGNEQLSAGCRQCHVSYWLLLESATPVLTGLEETDEKSRVGEVVSQHSARESE